MMTMCGDYIQTKSPLDSFRRSIQIKSGKYVKVFFSFIPIRCSLSFAMIFLFFVYQNIKLKKMNGMSERVRIRPT